MPTGRYEIVQSAAIFYVHDHAPLLARLHRNRARCFIAVHELYKRRDGLLAIQLFIDTSFPCAFARSAFARHLRLSEGEALAYRLRASAAEAPSISGTGVRTFPDDVAVVFRVPLRGR